MSDTTALRHDHIENALAAALGVSRVAEPSADPAQDGESSLEGLLDRVARNTVELAQHRALADLRASTSSDVGGITGLRVMSAGGNTPAVRLEGSRAAVQAAARLLYHPDLVIGLRPPEVPQDWPPGWTVEDDGARSPSGAFTVIVKTSASEEGPPRHWVVVEGDDHADATRARAEALAVAWALGATPHGAEEACQQVERLRSDLDVCTVELEGTQRRLDLLYEGKNKIIDHLRQALRAEAGDVSAAPSPGWSVGREQHGPGDWRVFFEKYEDSDRYTLRAYGGATPRYRIYDSHAKEIALERSTTDVLRGMLDADAEVARLLAQGADALVAEEG